MDRGAWQGTVHGVAKSRKQLSNSHSQLIYNVLRSVLVFILLCSKVIQLHTHMYIFFFIFFSIMAYLRILNIVPHAIQQDLVVYPSYIQQSPSANPTLLILASSSTSLTSLLFPTPSCFSSFHSSVPVYLIPNSSLQCVSISTVIFYSQVAKKDY